MKLKLRIALAALPLVKGEIRVSWKERKESRGQVTLCRMGDDK